MPPKKAKGIFLNVYLRHFIFLCVYRSLKETQVKYMLLNFLEWLCFLSYTLVWLEERAGAWDDDVGMQGAWKKYMLGIKCLRNAKVVADGGFKNITQSFVWSSYVENTSTFHSNTHPPAPIIPREALVMNERRGGKRAWHGFMYCVLDVEEKPFMSA